MLMRKMGSSISFRYGLQFFFVSQHAFSIEFYLESMSFLGRCQTFVGHYNPLCKWLTEMYYFLLQIFIANRDIDRLSDNQLTKNR